MGTRHRTDSTALVKVVRNGFRCRFRLQIYSTSFNQNCPEAVPLFLLSRTAQRVKGMLPVGLQCCGGLPPGTGYVLFIRNPVLWLLKAEDLN